MVQRAKRLSLKISSIFSLAVAACLAFFGRSPAAQATGTATQPPSGATRPAGAAMEEQKPTTQAVDPQRPTTQAVDYQQPQTQAVDPQRPATQAVDYQKPPH